MSSSKKRRNEPGRIPPRFFRSVASGVRSTQEALTYLRRLGVSPAAATQIVNDVRARGLLDDRACARLWADHWARAGYAESAVRAKLSAKGFGEAAIREAVEHLGLPASEEARARELAGTLLRRPAGQVARRLASRGFSEDVIERVVREPDPSA
jgi:SOS response regulatory protein OraA/RecX